MVMAIALLLWCISGYVSYILGEKYGTETSYPFFGEKGNLKIVFCTLFGFISLYWLCMEMWFERRDK